MLGMFLGTLFIMAMVLIIYYKQVSEGYEDRRQFEIMQKVGMSQQEMKKVIRSDGVLPAISGSGCAYGSCISNDRKSFESIQYEEYRVVPELYNWCISGICSSLYSDLQSDGESILQDCKEGISILKSRKIRIVY